MRIIHCTKKLLKEVPGPILAIEDIKADVSGLGNWHSDIFRIHRKEYIVFTNEETLYTFFIYDIKKHDIESIAALFIDNLVMYLRKVRIEENIINQIIQEYKEIGFSKTDNNNVVTSMEYFCKLFELRMEYIDEINEREILIANLQVNTTPMALLDYDSPKDRIKALIAKRYTA